MEDEVYYVMSEKYPENPLIGYISDVKMNPHGFVEIETTADIMMQKKFTLGFIKSLLMIYPPLRDKVEFYKATSKYEPVSSLE